MPTVDFNYVIVITLVFAIDLEGHYVFQQIDDMMIGKLTLIHFLLIYPAGNWKRASFRFFFYCSSEAN